MGEISPPDPCKSESIRNLLAGIYRSLWEASLDITRQTDKCSVSPVTGTSGITPARL